jgi:hypothetical protein
MKGYWPLLLCAALSTLGCCCLTSLLGMDPLPAGTAAPDFTLSSLAGDTVSLADFEGQPVLLNFWSPT